MEITVTRYTAELSLDWNKLVSEARNGLFLFDRGYMDYHADRFKDHSLLFYQNDELLGVLPANERDGELFSHGGLTYGGLILSKRASSRFVLSAFESLINYAREKGLNTLTYKAVPYIFFSGPSQEDLYALTRNDAVLYRRDISSIIDLRNRYPYTKGTKSNLSKGRKQGLTVVESQDYGRFMAIEEEILRTKYSAKPTHSAEELAMLAARFPENIRLFLVMDGSGTCLGGTVIFETNLVSHTQYIGITDQGKDVGALDILIDQLLARYEQNKWYFSFGISTEQEGTVLNEGLIRNKESFGARGLALDFYRINLS